MGSVLNDVRFGSVSILDVFDSMRPSKAWYDKVHLTSGDG